VPTVKITYPGPFPAVDVPSLGLFDVERGQTVDLDDEAGAESLVAQGWKRVAPTKAAPADKADKAAPTTKAATAAKKEQ
jgi:hypothetical protein